MEEAAAASDLRDKQPPEPADIRILRALRRIMQAVDIYSRKLKAQYQITGPQLVCLLSVVHDGPLTVSGLSRSVHLSPGTIVGIVDRLEARGLVIRTRSGKDRRQVHVIATEDGKALAASAPSALQDRLADGLRGLGELEQTAIALSLERIVELMEVGHLDAAPILAAGPVQPAGDKKP